MTVFQYVVMVLVFSCPIAIGTYVYRDIRREHERARWVQEWEKRFEDVFRGR